MRKIKFRAWDVDAKKMLYDDDVNILCIGNGTGWEAGKFYDDGDYVGFPLMQFTGLHDKNGKDVYEGDIVKFSGDDHVRTAEEADRPIQKITWGSRGWNAPQSVESRWEVLGNIHENQELLK